MRAPLTPMERQVYHFLLDFLADNTFQPSVREIAGKFKIPSTKSVVDLLASLEAKGYMRRVPGRSRGVHLIGFAGGAGTMPVPVMRAGENRRELEPEDYVSLDRRLVPADDAFLVRVTHEAAPAHGVRLGDLVLVHPSARVKDGDVAVVRVANTVLVGTLERRGATLLLANPPSGLHRELGPGDDFAVIGVLAGVIRLPAPEPIEPTGR